MSSFTRRMQRAHSLARLSNRLDPWGKFLRTGNITVPAPIEEVY